MNNKDRAEQADRILDIVAQRQGQQKTKEYDEMMTDFLANLMHNHKLYYEGVPFDKLLETARMHFEAELKEEAEPEPQGSACQLYASRDIDQLIAAAEIALRNLNKRAATRQKWTVTDQRSFEALEDALIKMRRDTD